MIHEEEVRREVEAKLGRRVSDFFWQMLVEDNYLEEYEQYGDLKLLVDRIRKLERIAKQSNADIRPPKEPVVRDVAPDRRLRYLSEICAVEAARLPEVVSFREKYLDGRLLAFDEVEEWIKRTAVSDGPGSIWFTVPVRIDYLVKIDGPFPRVRDLRETLAQLPESELNRFVSGTRESLAYVVPTDEHTKRIPIQHAGVLNRLKQLADRLESLYGWSEAHAVVFILTGLTPPIPKARVTTSVPLIGNRGRIKLELDPRLSPDEVRDIYARARSEVFKGRDRPMSEKHLELALFLVKNPNYKWREMCELWNKQNPQWAYTNWQNFSRDARWAYFRLTGREWVHEGNREKEGDE